MSRPARSWSIVVVAMLAGAVLMTSCSLFENVIGPESSTSIPGGAAAQNPWTVIFYMNGDNDLSADAFADLNAIEAAAVGGKGITMLALVDLGTNGGSISGGWPDARLYKIQQDPGGVNDSVVSTRLGAGALGLTTTGTSDDVNMGDPATLAALVSFAKTNYPSQHYALIFWGHAEGWRSIGTDSSSGDALTVGEVGQALSRTSLDVVAFDTPSEATIETADELSSSARYLIASECTSATGGWDLESMLTSFASSSQAPLDLVNAIVTGYSSQNASTPGTDIAAIDLTALGPVMSALNNLSADLGRTITTSSDQSSVRGLILTNVQNYRPVNPPGDESIDLWDLADVLENPPPPTPAATTTPNYATTTDEEALKSAVAAAVTQEWHNSSGADASHGLAVYFVTLDASGSPLAPPNGTPVDAGYAGDVSTPNALAFFTHSTWPPASASGSSGALWTIWLASFP